MDAGALEIAVYQRACFSVLLVSRLQPGNVLIWRLVRFISHGAIQIWNLASRFQASARERVKGTDMRNFQLSLMEKNDIQESVRVLSLAMLNNPLHIAIFQGESEKERMEIERTFSDLFNDLPGIVFLAKENGKIIGVMRMKSCQGKKSPDDPKGAKDENDVNWRKSVWQAEWARHDPVSQHWHLGPIGVLPSHQGLGVGSTLMERFCEEVDVCSAEAYLETDLDKNVRFYEKFGFKLVSETEIFGVKNRYMLRDAVA